MQNKLVVVFLSKLLHASGESWDFEDGNLPFWGGKGGSISSEDAHSGSKSFKVAGGKYDVGHYKGPRVSSNHWGRVWLKYSEPNAKCHAAFIALSHPSRGELRVVDTMYGPWSRGKHQYLLNFPDDQDGTGTEYSYDFNKWKCYEWHIDGQSKTFSSWEDGQAVISNFRENNIHNGDSEMRVGMAIFQDECRNQVFLDDLAIGTQRIGCSGTSTEPVNPGSPPVPSPSPSPGNCVPTGEDCSATRCCSEAGMTCFRKDSSWASCREECTPGIYAGDPVQYQTPWTCEALGSATPGTPATPQTPATPRTPSTPATPRTPSTPATPSTPSTPATPMTPATPSVPKNTTGVMDLVTLLSSADRKAVPTVLQYAVGVIAISAAVAMA